MFQKRKLKQLQQPAAMFNFSLLTDNLDDKHTEMPNAVENKAQKMTEIFSAPFQSRKICGEHFAAQLIAF
jgi:hypothetical protein